VAREQTTKPKGRAGGRWGGPKFAARRKVCTFCANKGTRIDYKDVGLLGRYLTDRAKILPRRRTGNCARHQRALATAIKRARYLALLPYAADHIYEMGTTYEIGRPQFRREATRPAPAEAAKTTKQAEAATTSAVNQQGAEVNAESVAEKAATKQETVDASEDKKNTQETGEAPEIQAKQESGEATSDKQEGQA